MRDPDEIGRTCLAEHEKEPQEHENLKSIRDRPKAESNSETEARPLPTQLRLTHIPFRCSEAVKEAEATDGL